MHQGYTEPDDEEDFEEWERTASAAEQKGRDVGRRLGSAEPDMWVLTRLIRAYAQGRYRRIPWTSLIAAAGAVSYFVWPFDVIPDFLLFIGFVDDLAVLHTVIRALRYDIDDFVAWENEGSPPD